MVWFGGSSRFWPPPPPRDPQSCNPCLAAGAPAYNVRANRQLIRRTTWRPFLHEKCNQSLFMCSLLSKMELLLDSSNRSRPHSKLYFYLPAISSVRTYYCPLEFWRVIGQIQIIVSRRGASGFKTVLPFSSLHLFVLSKHFYSTNGANAKFSWAKESVLCQWTQWSRRSHGNKTVSDKSCIHTQEWNSCATCSVLCNSLSSTLPRHCAPSPPVLSMLKSLEARDWRLISHHAGAVSACHKCLVEQR